jgi:transposase InsO family protein
VRGFFVGVPWCLHQLLRVLADFVVFPGALKSATFTLSRPIVSASESTPNDPKSARVSVHAHKNQWVTFGLINQLDCAIAINVARCTVERLMKRLGWQGARRGKVVRTTTPDKTLPCPQDRGNRQFKADRPNQLWVSDLTYVSTW